MQPARSSFHLVMLAIITLCAISGVCLQLATTLPNMMNNGNTLAASLARFFSYFTILTNSMIALTTGVAWLLPKTRAGAWCSKPGNITAITVYIIVVGLVYNFVLRPLYHPQGWAKLADELVHSVVPLLYVVYWLRFATRGTINWNSAFGWLLYPLLYLIYTFVHGMFSHWYPYPFMDVNIIGYAGFWINSAYLLMLFVCLNLALITIDKRIARRKRQQEMPA